MMEFHRLPERVLFPPLLFFLYLVIFHSVPKKQDSTGEARKPDGVFMAKMLLVVFLVFFTAYFLNTKHDRNKTLANYEQSLNVALGSFHPTDNQLYAIWDSSYPFELMGAFNDYEFFRHCHFIWFAAFGRSPFAADWMDRFGVKNFFRDMVDNPNLFLISWPYYMNLYQAHMLEKYQLATELETVFTSSFFNVYRVHSAKLPSHLPKS